MKLQLEGRPEIERKTFVLSLDEYSKQSVNLGMERWKEILKMIDSNRDKMISEVELDALGEEELNGIAHSFGVYDAEDRDAEEDDEEEGGGDGELPRDELGELPRDEL